ncbi:hypothetical protein D3C78_1774870 [compost metagenome]
MTAVHGTRKYSNSTRKVFNSAMPSPLIDSTQVNRMTLITLIDSTRARGVGVIFLIESTPVSSVSMAL